MKRFLLLISAATFVSAQPPVSVHQVYVMPMAGGLDQYLAEWLTREHVAQVVTDPKIADTVMTDRLGDAFEARLDQIRAPEPVEKDSKDPSSKTEETAGTGGTSRVFKSGIARGTMFLVDAKTRQVLWSDYEKPRGISDRNLNREAEKIVKRLAGKPASGAK